jgi:hypothetical protein
VCNEESTCLPQFIWVPNSRMKSAEHVQHGGGINSTFRSVVVTSRGLCSYRYALGISVEIDFILLLWTKGNWLLLGDKQSGTGNMVISRLFCKG